MNGTPQKKGRTCVVCQGIPPATRLSRRTAGSPNAATSHAARATCGASLCLAAYVLGDSLRHVMADLTTDVDDESKLVVYVTACLAVVE